MMKKKKKREREDKRTRNVRPTRTPARSPSRSTAYASTSRPRRRWPYGLDKQKQGVIAVYDLAAAPSIFPCWKSATACSR